MGKGAIQLKKVFKKLNSSRGSSMLLALMLVLVGLMVSQTILAAASSAGKNVIYQRDNQQAYLTVSSAAQAFVDSIGADGKKDFLYQKVTQYSDYDLKNPTGTPVVSRNSPTGAFTAELQRATEWVNLNKAAYSRRYTVRVPDYDPVALEIRIEKKTSVDDPGGGYAEEETPDKIYDDEHYLLTAIFSNALPGQELPETPYQMAVTMEGVRKKTVTSYTKDLPAAKTVKYTWTFGNAQLQRVEDVR